MEKLIRFINEYEKTSNCWPFETCRLEPATDYASSYLVLSWDDNWEWDWKDWHFPIPRLISKEYGFIKRLVENDKIDLDKVEFVGEWTTKYQSLLMLLSISDTPIEDLISYLK